MLKRLFFSGLVASALVVAGAVPASASLVWCEEDPLVTIVTPSGRTAEVYVTTLARGDHLNVLQREQISYAVVEEDPDGATVTLTVSLPDVDGRPFQTMAIVSTGAGGTGDILADRHGSSTAPLRLKFRIGLD